MKIIQAFLLVCTSLVVHAQTDSIHFEIQNNKVLKVGAHEIIAIGNQNSASTIFSSALAIGGTAVRGIASFSSFDNVNYGGWFEAKGLRGRGVYGLASSNTGVNYGGYFASNSANGRGVAGYANGIGNVTNIGGYFRAYGATGYGVYTLATAGSGIGIYSEGASRAAHLKGSLLVDSKSGDAIVEMESSSSTSSSNRVLVRQNTTNDVFIGDIDNNDGKTILRAAGSDAVLINESQNVGIGVVLPQDRLEINSSSSGALHVKANNSTALRVHSNRGASIGFNATPPTTGLRVANLANGTDGALRADGNGNIYKSSSNDQWYNISTFDFRERDNGGFIMNESYVSVGGVDRILFAPVHLPHNATIKQLKIYFDDFVNANLKLRLIEINQAANTTTTIVSCQSVGTTGSGQDSSIEVNHIVANDKATYYVQMTVEGGFASDVVDLLSAHIKYVN